MNNKKIVYVLIFFSILFLSLCAYLTTVGVFKKEEYTKKDLGRSLIRESIIIRGDIYDKNGTKLAYSEIKDTTSTRIYPYKNLYSHTIGYYTEKRGSSLLENRYTAELNGLNLSDDVIKIASFLNDKKPKGNDLYLTIDHKLQQKCYNLLSSYKEGAIIVSNPKTGEILAMVSKPDFDPSTSSLYKNWEKLSTDDKNFPFLTRATQGLYAPGSTYKIITSVSLIENKLDTFETDDEGSITINGTTIKNAKNKPYGKLDLQNAFKVSSNVYFGQAGINLGADKLVNTAKNFYLGKEFDVKDMYIAKSNIQTKDFADDTLALTSIGQGETLISPIHLNLITSAIANDGKMMQPYIVDYIKSNIDGSERKTFSKTLTTVCSKEVADIIKNNMKIAVESGTGAGANISGKSICGKTGTAENERTNENENATHSWFTAFAPYENPNVCVTVMLAYQGSSSIAVNVARSVFNSYFNLYN